MNKFSIHCPHFPICSGCTLSEKVDAPPVLKEMRSFFQTRGLSNLPIHAGAAEGWRCRAKLAVRGSAQTPIVGLYQKGSHHPIDIPLCRVHHPALNQAADALRHFIQSEDIEPYNEQTFQGELRYIQLALERSTGKVQLVLVVNRDSTSINLEKLWSIGIPWHSIWLNHNTRRDNVIFGNEWVLFKGEPFLWEAIGGVSICFHPASFGQANLDLFERLIASLKAQLHSACSLVEYHAGVGMIGLCLAEKCQTVVSCEANPQAAQCFILSKEKLGADIQKKLSYRMGRAEENLHLLQEGDVILVDPPRKGLDAHLLKGLKELQGPKTLFYISCGWPAFQRDCDALQNAGWKLEHAEGYTLFPGTDHVELLARFKKESG
ncbi:MAG: hypothetical protein LLG04_18615 [Parachlamydia sp.]|nr:hypothetical protein [Parachlamydia sp.]